MDDGNWQVIRMNLLYAEIPRQLELLSRSEEAPKKKKGQQSGSEKSRQMTAGLAQKRRRGRPLRSKIKSKHP